jgi:APA family basic amino acid/polyamine antiporter
VLPASEVATLNDKAAVAVSEKLFGPFGATLIHLGILISIFGCLNGNTMTTTRVPFAMGERGDLPFSSWIGTAHPSFGTPANAIILQTTVALLMILSGNPDLITDIGISAVYVFYIFAFIGITKLRKDKVGETLTSYRVPLYPIIPIIAALGGAFIIYSTIVNQPYYALAALVLTLAGLPVHYSVEKRRNAQAER